MSSDKSLLRKQCKQARSELSQAQQLANSQALCRTIDAYLGQLAPQRIASYLAFGAEISVDVLFSATSHHQWFAPIIAPEFGMRWGAVDLSRLHHNGFGIREPQQASIVAADRFDIMLLPLVGYDRDGNRIGMGAGYYDRALGSVRQRPILIGCAHSIQECQAIAAEPWDVRLDAIATENGLIWLN